MWYWNNLLQEIINANNILIYGAGLMGKTVKRCLEDAPYKVKIKAFIVDSLENHPSNIDGIPVMNIAQAMPYREELLLIALHEKNISDVPKRLSEFGFCHVRLLSFDSDEWSDIRGNWFQNLWSGRQEQYIHLKDRVTDDFRIYVVHSTADHVFKEKIENRSFEVSIQVGAALTNKRIAGITDSQGDNISAKNKKYCELTALYWIWKNDTSKYTGLSHYRRKFTLSEPIGAWLPKSDIDVVLTVPVLNILGVKQQYCIDHIASDWDIMMESIGSLYPEYLDTADRIQKGNYYYAYNMFIARKEILNQYCEWLFPILFWCEDKIGERQDAYQGRYLGFLAERLMTIFFENHKENYKIAIADKHFSSQSFEA